MPANKSIKCGKCDEPINKSGSIMCKLCSRWFHSKCVDLSDKDLQALSVIKCCAFICDACENNRNGSLEKKLDAFITKYDDDQLDIKNSLDTIRKDMATHLTELKADILECNKKLSSHKAQVSSKFLQQDIEINILHKRINRGDIIISGLPTGIQDLESTIISLGAFYKVDVSKFDINHIGYINNNKMILVKFTRNIVRDSIMKEYFKTRSLKVGDVLVGIGSDIERRVYLNDHFSPAASKLNMLCKQLQRKKIIMKFKVLNTNVLKARLVFADGKEVNEDVEGVKALLESNGNEIS